MNNSKINTQVLIIGGGATGTGIARDLALRGIQCVLAEKIDINAGASGANHGLLHSGARYIGSDYEAAKECRSEGGIIKHLMPQIIEDTGGIFVAIEGDNEQYIADFPNKCGDCGIKSKKIDIKEAREIEPSISEKVIAAYLVEDASVDPFKLSLDHLAHAQQFGCRYLKNSKVLAFNIVNNKIQNVEITNCKTGEKILVEAQLIVNAAGAWAREVANFAGIEIDLLYSKGTLLVTQSRISKRVINRLRQASNADILVPGGTVSILGTTSVRIDSLEDIYPTVEETDFIIEEGAKMAPVLLNTRYIRAYAGVRPLFGKKNASDDRSVSRGFALIDHDAEGVNNFVTITGGKLTTFRLMAEKTCDLVCKKLGFSAQCKTRTEPLPASNHCRWTEPGLAPKNWIKNNDPNDILLCECDMVSRSTVDEILKSFKEQNINTDLTAIGLRSRVGKGPCQGTFCSVRVLNQMYDKGFLSGSQGIDNIKEFLQERWKGQRPITWDIPLIQYEMQEAMHCGFFGLELDLKNKIGEI